MKKILTIVSLGLVLSVFSCASVSTEKDTTNIKSNTVLSNKNSFNVVEVNPADNVKDTQEKKSKF